MAGAADCGGAWEEDGVCGGGDLVSGFKIQVSRQIAGANASAFFVSARNPGHGAHGARDNPLPVARIVVILQLDLRAT